ncbi:hypothetical protein HZH68_002889 [Vespula germanica]|uniref:Uncharacterized protein n=1 Tax=Vespula germanica TaxID=30212 RepID=A0A834NN51_VESGE|nr:hypothetical protein HZH68_002889 [Vespula germanica]
MDLHMQQPPRGEIWVGITCDKLNSKSRLHNASTTGRMAMMSLRTLTKIASVTGFIVAGTGYAFRFKIQNDLRETKLYKDGMQYLYNHPKAVDLLGSPIEEKRVNISDNEKNGTKENITWFTVPVVGSQKCGELRIEANLVNNAEKELVANIYKVELTIKEIPGKVFVIKDDSVSITNIS